MSGNGILIGKNIDTNGLVHVDEKTRSTHMQIIGSTGTGKSKFIEHLIREDILSGKGLLLIDPHGHMYKDIVEWLQAVKFPENKIVLFDPSNDAYVTGFNPLQVTDKDLSFHVDAMVRSVAKVWGSEDQDKTPLLKRCLRITFHALCEGKLSLLESQYLTSPVKQHARQYLAKDIQDPIIKEQWDYLNTLKARPFYEEMGSTINRLMEFLAADRIRNILGQIQKPLNFREIMDQGYVVLCNLSSGQSISHDNAQLLGSLIVNELFMTATGRPAGSRPFYLYIDECGLFISEDVARILDEGRKFGLHLILGHQHLAQLKKAGEDIYQSVMADARTKVCFGGLSPEDAKIMAELMFLSEIDLDKIRRVLDRPTVVGYTTTFLESYSQGRSVTNAEAYSQAMGRSTGKSKGAGESLAVPLGSQGLVNWLSMGETGIETTVSSESSMSGLSEVTGKSLGFSETHSETKGMNEALLPVIEYFPTSTYSLEEQIFESMRILINQDTRHAVVKLPGLFTKRIKTPLVEKLPLSGETAAALYIKQCNEKSCYNKTAAEAREEIQTRRQQLLEAFEAYKQEELEKAEKEKLEKSQKTKPKI